MFAYVKKILMLSVVVLTIQGIQGNQAPCRDESICPQLIASTPCTFLKLSEQLRCPVSCNRCSSASESSSTQNTITEASSDHVATTSSFLSSTFPTTTIASSTCPHGCVDVAEMQRWIENYQRWLDDYKTWKEQFLIYKALADQGRACG
uniref:ShKT domain-containing protein n=1 Tax=Ciona savignyi TaxID=51511 RepID=H2YUM2_CIOSA